jgi:FHA domain
VRGLRRRATLRDVSVEDLLAECVEHPDDDRLRLVWGDAIGGERAELVAIQCADREALSRSELAVLNRRERQLLVHGMNWSGLGGIAHRVQYERGFVDAIDIDAEAYVEHNEHIAEVAPFITALTLRRIDDPEVLRAVLDTPTFVHVRALKLDQHRGFESSRVLARSQALRKLVALDMQFEEGSLFHMIEAGISHVERMRLIGGNAASLEALGFAATSLVSFETNTSAPIFDQGFAKLTDLTLYSDYRNSGIDWLPIVRPLVNRLERFSLTSTRIDPSVLSEFVALRELELHDDEMPSGTLLGLAKSPPPKLCELRLEHTDVEAVEAVAVALAGRLDLLDLRASPRFSATVACAGDLLVDEPLTYKLWHAGAIARAEWRPFGSFSGTPGSPAWIVKETGEISDLAENDIARISSGADVNVTLGAGPTSRYHATITWHDGHHWIADLGSPSGTLVDDVRVIETMRLVDGARLQLAEHTLWFFTDGVRASEAARRLARHY